MTFWEILFFTS